MMKIFKISEGVKRIIIATSPITGIIFAVLFSQHFLFRFRTLDLGSVVYDVDVFWSLMFSAALGIAVHLFTLIVVINWVLRGFEKEGNR